MVKELSETLNLDLDPALPPEQVLLMWLNYHLKKANVPRTVTNFGEDLKVSFSSWDELFSLLS